MIRRLLLVVAAAVLVPAHAEELGRLFFTPEQRAAFDARRKARLPDKPAPAALASPVTRLDGYVKRSAGPTTIWVNGETVDETAPDAPRVERPRADSSVAVSVGPGGDRIRLKPGELLDESSGQVRDLIGDGEIEIRRRTR